MKIFNTLTRSKDKVIPIRKDQMTMYSCGPTVYDSLTIGNWTAYVRWDILARTIRDEGLTMKWYMNITDVGHLVSDADSGEDKLEKGAKREGISAWEVADKYTEDFINGLDALNISFDKNNLVKATDHIQDQIDLIKILEEKNHTYVTEDGIYFDSTSFKDYGKMAKLDIQGLEAGSRVDMSHKKSATDFALWKFSPKNSTRDMEWKSPWGTGFPGWHIECSALAMKFLGPTIDIHTGGIDHIPIHHTNEIAQSESATGEQFVHYWIHSNFLKVDGKKISKSLGNIFTLADLAKKGYSALDFKFFVIHSSFHNEANFTWDSLSAAKERLISLKSFLDLRYQYTNNGVDISDQIDAAQDSIRSALRDNLNTPEVLKILSEIIDSTNQTINESSAIKIDEFTEFLDTILGLDLGKTKDIPIEIKSLIKSREIARNNKNWDESDNIRDQLLEMGIQINDTANGTIWSRT